MRHRHSLKLLLHGERCCDFVEFAPDKSTQMKKLVLWEPFPVIPTLRAGPFDAAQFKSLSFVLHMSRRTITEA